jgi:hypothetical protein
LSDLTLKPIDPFEHRLVFLFIPDHVQSPQDEPAKATRSRHLQENPLQPPAQHHPPETTPTEMRHHLGQSPGVNAHRQVPVGIKLGPRSHLLGVRAPWRAKAKKQGNSACPCSNVAVMKTAYTAPVCRSTGPAGDQRPSACDLSIGISGPTHENTLNAMTELAILYRLAR